MGRMMDLKEGIGSRPAVMPDAFELHVTSLIGQLEGLIEERKCAGQGEAAPDPATRAAAHLAMPYAVAPTPLPLPSIPRQRAALARDLVRQRRRRSDFLPGRLFAEPAWDMLLDLYAAQYEGKPVSVSSLCIAANVPSTTALRSIETMEEQGCLVRRRDPNDGRRMFLALSASARAGLDDYFDALGH